MSSKEIKPEHSFDQPVTPSEKDKGLSEELFEEFSIMELEERLEFVTWCDGNCNC